MKIKTKAALGIYVLVTIIISLGVISSYFIYKLSHASGQILKDNYVSVEYCNDMQLALEKVHQSYILWAFKMPDSLIGNSIPDYTEALEEFNEKLQSEEQNITETGEQEAVVALRNSLKAYANEIASANKMGDKQAQSALLPEVMQLHADIQKNLRTVSEINMNAISRKNNTAEKISEDAILAVSVICMLALFITLPILINFPGYIANPITEIKEKIREIANKNYDQKLYVDRHDELGELAIEFNKMTEKLQEYQRSDYAALMTEKRSIDSIVKNLNEGIILLDESQIIKVSNPVSLKLLDLDAKDLNGKYAPDVAIHNDLLRELIKDIKNNSSDVSRLVRITIDNEENYFNKEVYKVLREHPETKQEEVAGYIISLRNITEFKKLDLAKTNFMAIVSHELKTPISSISLSLKLLEDERVGILNEEQHTLIGSVREQASRLSKITGELLNIAQVETGNITLEMTSVSAADIIKFSADLMMPHFKAKNIQLIQDVSQHLPLVKADLEKTVWVMTNLLGNAVRYTPQNGKITISAHPSLKEVQFAVEDTGPGIDQKNKEKIFQRFVQLDRSEQRDGIGLGLAISKEFILEEGGKIWVESELGIGSKFIFTLQTI